MENLLTQYNQGSVGNQTRDQGASKFVFFRFVISGSAVKLPPCKKELPGDEISFTLIPLYPPARRAYGEFAGQIRPWAPSFINDLNNYQNVLITKITSSPTIFEFRTHFQGCEFPNFRVFRVFYPARAKPSIVNRMNMERTIENSVFTG